MKRCLNILLFLVLQLPLFAAVPPAEKLLPNDTMFMITAPDAAKLGTIWGDSSQMRFLADPAMKPFCDNFMKKFSADVIAPLEKELGIKFSDYKDLAQGQFTIAGVPDNWAGDPEKKMGVLLLIDTKDKKNDLKARLSSLQKKWIDSGKELKTEKIRDVEFTTIITSSAEMRKSFKNLLPKNEEEESEPEKKADTNKVEVTIGQSDSLLIVGNVKSVIEKVLVRQAGGISPALAEEATYEANHSMLFRDAALFGWVNLNMIIDALIKDNQKNPLSPSMFKTISALGLNGLKSISMAYTHTPEGPVTKIFIDAPEAGRKGIVKLLLPAAKDSAPPAFVPAETVKFLRWRVDLQKALTGLESAVMEINPASAGVFKLIFDSAGKDQDPNFDLRKELIGNMGDDFIMYEKKPRGAAPEDVVSPPSIFLVGSPNAEKLAHAVKVGTSVLSPDPKMLKEREFLGRKVYSISSPAMAAAGEKGAPKSLNFAASGGYVGFSTDVATLEEFIRSSENKAKPLSETPGLGDAIQKIGGTATGFLSYENEAEAVRVAFDMMKKEPKILSMLFGGGALGDSITPGDEAKQKEWFDTSLLPPYDAVAKYFHFRLGSGTADAKGFMFKIFEPTPPGLKK